MAEVVKMSEAARTGWVDLLAEGRLPRFALICLGVWLNAADSLVTATIMPSVGADLGGYAYFSWAVAGFLVGAILAGASAGRLSEMFGLRSATAAAGLVFAAGCVLSAAAPDMTVFLVGRLIQGLGSGWISGFAMVAIALLFPPRHLARVFAAVTAIWGIATVVGPLVGGVFAEAGDWRGVFWMFAAQAAAFALASVWLLKTAGGAVGGPGIPWRQLGLLGLSVAALAVATMVQGVALASVLVAAGFLFLGLVLRADGRAAVRLLPKAAGDLRTVCGAGYGAMFALTAAAAGLTVYGPAILQQLRGMSPLVAGYVVAAEAAAWTLLALAVAGATGAWARLWIRVGAVGVVVSLALLAAVMGQGPLAWVIVGAALLGGGFGLFSALMNQQVLGALAHEDRAIGSSAIIAVRQTGGAAGAAIAGVAANLVGFGDGLSAQSAQAASVWVFVTALPLALAGAWAAFRLTGSARAAGP